MKLQWTARVAKQVAINTRLDFKRRPTRVGLKWAVSEWEPSDTGHSKWPQIDERSICAQRSTCCYSFPVAAVFASLSFSAKSVQQKRPLNKLDSSGHCLALHWPPSLDRWPLSQRARRVCSPASRSSILAFIFMSPLGAASRLHLYKV